MRTDNIDEVYSLLADKAPISWLGHGMSLALCALSSSLCKIAGIESCYSTPEENDFLTSLGIVEITASNRNLTDDPILKVIGLQKHGSSSLDETSNFWIHTLPVASTWCDTEFGLLFLDWVTQVFDLKVCGEFKENFELPSQDNAQIVILVERHVQVFRQLCHAASCKIPNLNFIVVGMEEFGHGLHHLIWRDPDVFKIIVARGPDCNEVKLCRLEEWLAGQNTPVTQLNSEHSATSAEFLIQVFRLILKLVVQRCENMGLDPDISPMPVEIDTLR